MELAYEIVLLRGISPHANEYELKHLIRDIMDIGQGNLFTNESGGALEKKFSDFFQGLGIDFDKL